MNNHTLEKKLQLFKVISRGKSSTYLKTKNSKKMTRQILKTILIGAVVGTALFFMPFFVLKVAIFLIIAGFFLRMFTRYRWRGHYGWAYGDKIRQMSDDEYSDFKEKFRDRCRGFQEAEAKNPK